MSTATERWFCETKKVKVSKFLDPSFENTVWNKIPGTLLVIGNLQHQVEEINNHSLTKIGTFKVNEVIKHFQSIYKDNLKQSQGSNLKI
jgi:hypothetical protein